jgi:hypothetical protein
MPKQERFGKRVGNTSIQKLLKDPLWEPFLPLTSESEIALQHPDGRVLIYREGVDYTYLVTLRDGFLVDADKVDRYLQLKQEIADQYAKELAKHGSGVYHVLDGLLPQGKDFTNQIPELIKQLSSQINMPFEELDYSEDSVRRVENKLRRMGRKTWLEPALFSSVLAYMTEMLRRSVPEGHIRMRLYKDDKTWEPWVVDGEGRVAQVFLMIYDAMVEGPFMIQWHRIEGHLRSHPPNGFWENDSQ